MIGKDLRMVESIILGCPECGSHDTIMIVSRDGTSMDSSITCMRCGYSVHTMHILRAARIWGTVEAFS